ncbi:MAG: TIM barrel protein [Phycisphaeraceae bacterium]
MRISTSSYSLHGTLGTPMYQGDPRLGQLVNTQAARDGLDLLALPGRLAAHGIATLELCHFHLPAVDADYLGRLRTALDEASVELFSLLIDAGDIGHADDAQRQADAAWIASWLQIAGRLGASHARVAPGHTAPDETVIERVAGELAALSRVGQAHGVQVITENWHAFNREADALLAVLDRCDEPVGLCADFGNAEGENKYALLGKLLPRATSIHAKARYDDAGRIDGTDLARCMDMAREARFDGPVSLIYADTSDEWAGLAVLHDVVRPYAQFASA